MQAVAAHESVHSAFSVFCGSIWDIRALYAWSLSFINGAIAQFCATLLYMYPQCLYILAIPKRRFTEQFNTNIINYTHDG